MDSDLLLILGPTNDIEIINKKLVRHCCEQSLCSRLGNPLAALRFAKPSKAPFHRKHSDVDQGKRGLVAQYTSIANEAIG